MEEYLSPAFYMIPAIDDAKNNVIYINEGRMPDNLTLFTTLAHEVSRTSLPDYLLRLHQS